MPLQLNTIEEYNFVHGLHRNYVNGKYIAIQPHDLGRPLTHAEMDYNLILNEQTQAGFRIFGSNADLTLSDDDIGKSLVFHKITADDDDFTKYQTKGYSVDQYIWILSCCDHFHCEFFVTDHHDGITSTDSEWCQFVVDTISSEDSGVCAFIVDSITSTPEDPCVTFVVDTIVAQDSLIHAGTPTPTPSSSEAAPTPTPSSSEAAPTPTPSSSEAAPTPTPSSSEAAPTPTPTPTTSAVYPMLNYADDQAWLQVLADWEANNPNCQTPMYSTGSFFQEKASIHNSFTSDPLLSSTHRRRHVLYLVSEIQPLDAALLEEYRIWKGCPISVPNTPTPTPSTSEPVPTATATPTPTVSTTNTATPTPTASTTNTPTPTPTASTTATATPTPTPTSSTSATPTPTPTVSGPNSVWQIVPGLPAQSGGLEMDEHGILADASQVFYIKGRYVHPGTSYTWDVRTWTSANGNGASAADFAGGVWPSGSGIWPASPGYTTYNNGVDYNTPHTIIPFADQLTEPLEYYKIRLFDQNGILVATYDQTSIVDTSQDPTYALSVSSPVNENSQNVMTFTLQTTNHFSGDTIPFTLSGTAISGTDYTNATTGQFTLNGVWSNNAQGVPEYQGTYDVTIITDALTEGPETITLTLDGIGTSITGTITDSSETAYNYDCAAAELIIDDGTTGDPVTGNILPYNGSASWGGNIVSFSPSTYQSGTTSYTAIITAPSSDNQGTSYANSGQNISCSANANGLES